MNITDKDAQRFVQKLGAETDTGCIEWTAGRHRSGYGMFSLEGKHQYAHRVAYAMEHGHVPDGMDIDHRCFNRACVAVGHLQPLTHKENLERRAGANKNSRTGIRGVSQTPEGYFRGAVKHYGKAHMSRAFETATEAEAWVQAKRAELFTHAE